VNKDTQMPGRTKGFSLKPGAVNKYYLFAEYRSVFIRQLKHTDLQPSRIAKDEADVKSLESMLNGSWINPFLGSQQDLLCLLSGKLATPEIERDLLQAEASGEKAFRTFSCERLESNPPKVKFNDPMKKMKLKTFADLAKSRKSAKQQGRKWSSRPIVQYLPKW